MKITVKKAFLAVLGIAAPCTFLAVAACDSGATSVPASKEDATEEIRQGEDYSPSYDGYKKGLVVSTNLSAATLPGAEGAYTTYDFYSDGSFEKSGLPAKNAFRITYRWTVLPSEDSWTMPTVNHVDDSRQKWFSYFYDSAKATDAGSALTTFLTVHDGDTFALRKTTELQGVASAIGKELDVTGFTLGDRFRLFGADAPETGYPPSFAKTAGVESLWAVRATNFVKANLATTASPALSLVTPNGNETYSRAVGNVKYVPKNLAGSMAADAADKQSSWNDLSADLIRFGLARLAYTQDAYTKRIDKTSPGVNALNKDYINYLIELQRKAMDSRTGIWSEPKRRWWNESGKNDGGSLASWNPDDDVFAKAIGITEYNGLA